MVMEVAWGAVAADMALESLVGVVAAAAGSVLLMAEDLAEEEGGEEAMVEENLAEAETEAMAVGKVAKQVEVPTKSCETRSTSPAHFARPLRARSMPAHQVQV
jgi:hypothetical protein